MSTEEIKKVKLPCGNHFDETDFDVYSSEFYLTYKGLRLEVPVVTEDGCEGEVGDWLMQAPNGTFCIIKDEQVKKYLYKKDKK